MALLRSVKNGFGVDYHEYRDRLYFNQYRYKLLLRIEGNPNSPPGSSPTPGILLPRIDRLRIWYAPRREQGVAVCRREGARISVFSNDLQSLLSIADLTVTGTPAPCCEAIVHFDSRVKLFEREPNHKFRVYLKDIRVPFETQASLITFLKNNPDVFPSRTLLLRLHRKSYLWKGISFSYFYSSYYMDYDDEAKLSHMALLFGELLGKHYRLEKRPDALS